MQDHFHLSVTTYKQYYFHLSGIINTIIFICDLSVTWGGRCSIVLSLICFLARIQYDRGTRGTADFHVFWVMTLLLLKDIFIICVWLKVLTLNRVVGSFSENFPCPLPAWGPQRFCAGPRPEVASYKLKIHTRRPQLNRRYIPEMAWPHLSRRYVPEGAATK